MYYSYARARPRAEADLIPSALSSLRFFNEQQKKKHQYQVPPQYAGLL